MLITHMATSETRGIKKRFGEVTAVNGIDLLDQGRRVSGAARPLGLRQKHAAAHDRRLRSRPREGELLIGGTVVNDLPPRARKIAMVFQSYALYPHMTVYKNIAFPLKAQRVEQIGDSQKVEWAASLFGIGHLLDRKPRELSGGERQRVALARALVREP